MVEGPNSNRYKQIDIHGKVSRFLAGNAAQIVIILDGVGGRLRLKSLDVCSLDEILRASSPIEEYPYRIFQHT